LRATEVVEIEARLIELEKNAAAVEERKRQ
jgi:hypothetical protein